MAAAACALFTIAVFLPRDAEPTRVEPNPSDQPLQPRAAIQLEPIPERGPEQRIDTPPDPAPVSEVDGVEASPDREISMRDIKRLAGPGFAVHVRDSATSAELTELEILLVPATTLRASWRMPAGRDPVVALASGATSPITIQTWRAEDDPDNCARGYDWSDAYGKTRSLRLARPHVLRRGLVLYARDADHAWGRLEIDPSSGGTCELLLLPTAKLTVIFANYQREGYASLDLEPNLFLRRTDVETGAVVRVQAVTRLLAEERFVLEGLEPGVYRASVELGKWMAPAARTVLGAERFELAAGEERELIIYLSDPPSPPLRARLAGWLTFPPFPNEDAVELRLFHMSRPRQRAGRPDHVIPLERMKRSGGESGAWRWDAGELAVGSYQAKVWPFLASFRIDLVEGEPQDVELDLGELAEVHVDVVDISSGERIDPGELTWSRMATFDGAIDNAGERLGHTGEPGRFHFWTVPGRIDLYASDAHEAGYGAGYRTFEVSAGPNALRLPLSKLCAIRFVFQDEGALLPKTSEMFKLLASGIVCVDGDARVTVDRSRKNGTIELSGPGVFDVTFEGVATERFRPIETRRVEVRAGETAEVVVALERR
ncbi:MAG: hypothetical protein GY711_13915 [bacterium]|nr:hypothetical protein [bacterium]